MTIKFTEKLIVRLFGVSKKDVAEGKEAAKCLEEDFELLRSGDWVPDDDSIDASQEMVEKLSNLVNKLSQILGYEEV